MTHDSTPKTWILGAAVAALLIAASDARAATIDAANCSQAAVQTAINAASNGDVVAVPGGACTWGAMSISKGIHLRGPGAAGATISLSGTLQLVKNSAASVRVSGFTFRNAGASPMVLVDGAIAAQPPLIHDNVFLVNGGSIMRYQTNGGVIWNNTFRSTRALSNGFSDDAGIQHKLQTNLANAEWQAADTMGARDADGRRNLYIEDNVFENMSNLASDFDDGSRIVFRRNRLTSASFNSHGLDTSPVGLRHFEIYDNQFLYPDSNVNQNWMIWIRGASGVVYNNRIDNLIGQMWGDKSEILLSVRMANDGGMLGCATSWPAPHQVGQNSTGSSQYLDPVYFWGNTGTTAWRINQWSNTCGQDINNYLRSGRDFVFGSSPKPGYAAYAYPHPLRGGSIPVVAPPSPPTNLTTTS